MSLDEPLQPSAQRVDRALRSEGLIGRVRELPDSTRTAGDAARALGCEVRQIVKSLVFRTDGTDAPVLALVAGDHRLDEAWMHRRTGEKWVRADPEFARSVSGFAIGGVPPVGHPTPLRTYVDYDLLEQREVWAAAGHPNAICRLTSDELLRITHGRPVSVVPLSPGPSAAGRWISFDCYGTLIDWRKGFVEAVEPWTGALEETEVERLFRAYLEEEMALEAGPYRAYREIMAEALTRASTRAGRPIPRTEAERLSDSVPEWPAFPDSRMALERIRDLGLRVAILSNIDRDLLSRTLANHRLPVDLTVTAEEVRSYKPAFAHWIRFLKATGATPSECRHVAGAYEYDLPPAARLGFRTTYVGRYSGAAPGPDAHEVRSSLEDLVLRLGSEPERTP